MHVRKEEQRPLFAQQGSAALQASPPWEQPTGCGGGGGCWHVKHCDGSTVGPHADPGGGLAPDGQRTWKSHWPLQQAAAVAFEAPHWVLLAVQVPGAGAGGGGGSMPLHHASIVGLLQWARFSCGACWLAHTKQSPAEARRAPSHSVFSSSEQSVAQAMGATSSRSSLIVSGRSAARSLRVGGPPIPAARSPGRRPAHSSSPHIEKQQKSTSSSYCTL